MAHDFLLAGLIPLHVLHHAVEGEIYGQAMLDELRHHGYHIGPGTLYPLLLRLEERGYVKVREERTGKTMRRHYGATPQGYAALKAVPPQVRELFSEVIQGRGPESHQHPPRRGPMSLMTPKSVWSLLGTATLIALAVAACSQAAPLPSTPARSGTAG